MSNYVLGDLVSRLNVASKSHLKSIDVLNNKISLNILDILYKNGVISNFYIFGLYIRVFLKYFKNCSVFYQLKLVSRPGHKIYWNLNKLSNFYSCANFNGFYIISTTLGLITSNDCLLGRRISGKILLKVFV